ncbi:MAG: CcmD family protein [Acidimicrobiia bacterium]|nr:CcmD family protein [Acidimicrobiia bacterium]
MHNVTHAGRLFVLISMIVVAGATHASPVLGAEQPASPPQQQDEFVPVDQLPPQDQLPAAPLLIAAYAFVLVALFAYVVSVARRLSTVQRELERLESDVKRSGRT